MVWLDRCVAGTPSQIDDATEDSRDGERLRAMSLAQLSRVATVTARTTGRRALYLALPLYFVVGIVAFVLFAGNGMNASEVTSLALDSPSVRLSLMVGWSVLTLPAARVLLTDSRVFFLRVLPVPRWWLLGIAGLGLVLVQLAWLVLWVRGEGVPSGVVAVLTVLGLQSYAIARLRGWREWVGLGAVLAGWLLAPSPLSLLLVIPAVAWGQRLAWIRAPEPEAAGRHAVISASATLAAATALGVSAYRTNGSAVARASALTLLAYAGTWLGLRHNPDWTVEPVQQLALALWGAACLLGGVTLARPMLSAEADLTALLDGCGMSTRSRVLSGIGLIASIGGLSGALFGLALVAAAPHSSADMAVPLHLVPAGAALAAIALALMRITTRGTGRDSGLQLLALLALVVAASLTLLQSPLLMIAFASTAAVLATAFASRVRLPIGARPTRGL
jgi:hypothetical protein